MKQNMTLLILILLSMHSYGEQCPPPTFPFKKYRDGKLVISCMLRKGHKFVKQGNEITYRSDGEILKTTYFENNQVVTTHNKERPTYIKIKQPKYNVVYSYPLLWKPYLKQEKQFEKTVYSSDTNYQINKALNKTIALYAFDGVSIEKRLFIPTFTILDVTQEGRNSNSVCEQIIHADKLFIKVPGISLQNKKCTPQTNTSTLGEINYDIDDVTITQRLWSKQINNKIILCQIIDLKEHTKRLAEAQVLCDSMTSLD